MLQLFQCVDIYGLGILCAVGMLRTVVNIHIVDELAAKTVLGEHAFHHMEEQGVLAGLDVLVERLLHQAFGSGLALTAGIAGVGQIDAVGPLVAGELHFVGVDDDHVVAALHVGRIAGLVFAAQDFSDFGAETAKNLVGGIDYHPLAVALLRIRSKGLVT